MRCEGRRGHSKRTRYGESEDYINNKGKKVRQKDAKGRGAARLGKDKDLGKREGDQFADINRTIWSQMSIMGGGWTFRTESKY